MADIINLVKNPPKKYRPLPFWSWNSKLQTEETTWQVGEMDRVGNGGFFMHARGGLTTEYMGKEWMDNVRAAVLDADKRGMNPWGYDENGYPSGFGSDAVNSLGVEYQQKYLRMEITDEPKNTEFTIINNKLDDGKNAHFYYDVNRFYIDALNPKVTDKFIEVTHEKYKEALGKDFSKMAGFFTDEPQLSRKGLPWSLILEDEYVKEYGESLNERLYDMFVDTETCYKTRYRFWKLVTRLFCENYMKRIYDWCEENGTQLTGHMVIEESIDSQIDCNGAIMPNYEYFHIPGIDKLCRSVNRSLLVPQVVSAAAQLGKKQILTESFAMCGWDVSFEELKWILEWQMVKGANLLCQHLSGYSLEGLRKRDYPAGHFYQNPWWNEYKAFMDFSSRMGMLLAEGELYCDVLVLHNVASAWVLRGSNESLQKAREIYDKSLKNVIMYLDRNQIINHLGDERLMARHGKVSGNKLVIGEMAYGTVIVPSAIAIDSNTYELLKEFSDNGGNLIFAGEVPSFIDGIASEKVKELCKKHAEDEKELVSLIPDEAKYCSVVLENGENADIQYARRSYEDFEMFYFVNTFSDRCENVTLTVPGKSCAVFDYLTGEVVPCEYEIVNGCVEVTHTFEKMGSFVLFVKNDDTYKSAKSEKKVLSPINDKLRGEWQIADADLNSLTLDYCDCYFDGELYKENIYVLDVQENACAFNRKVNVKLDFKVTCNMTKAAPMYLVVERPEFYTISINGKEIEKKEHGYYRDKSFKMLDITGLLENGENKITLVCDFVQSDGVYAQIKDCLSSFETAKNKLFFDMEIEDIYIVGDFGVDNSVPYEFDVNRTVRATEGNFSICDRPRTFKDGDFTSQKHPFFCGHMKVRKEIELSADEINNRSIMLSKLCSTVSNFTVNGKKLDEIYWAPYETDVSGLLKPGKNVIELDITGCFRNMLGPHHTKIEAYDVYPHSFLHISDIWYGGLLRWGGWYDGYSFVEYGLFLE